VDFGATREYSKEFIDDWLRLLKAAADDDRDGCVEWSLKLGYLTGKENKVTTSSYHPLAIRCMSHLRSCSTHT
jgi:aarF domain-containing kinase